MFALVFQNKVDVCVRELGIINFNLI
jgi:hypothetical protein